MKIDKTFTEDHQAKLTVELESQLLEESKQRAARKIAQRVKIPGFRPGKAPYKVVLRTVGEAAILDEAVELLVNEKYPTIISEAGIKPYGPGNLDNIQKLDPPTLEFTVPLQAEVTLGNYHSVRLPYELKPVTDEEVEQTIEDLRESMAYLEPVNRPAQEGDQVFIHLSAERKVVKEGQSLTLIRDREVPIAIDSADKENSKEWPFAGFSRNLIGLNPGDERVIEYTYPEDAFLESLRGTTVIFRLKVDDVKLRKLPDLNDEFAQSLGEFENLDALKKTVRQNLENKAKKEYDDEYNDKVLDIIIKDAQIKYPPQMLEDETNTLLRQLERRLAEQNLDMATYLKSRRMEEADLRKELIPAAETRMKRTLVLMEIARREKIQVSEDELKSETMRTLDSISRFYSPKEARKLATEPFIEDMVQSISTDLAIEHTLERLQQIAKGEYTPPAESAPSEAVKPKRSKRTPAKKASQPAPTAEPPAAEPADSAPATGEPVVEPSAKSTAQPAAEPSAERTSTTEKPKRARKTKSVEVNQGSA